MTLPTEGQTGHLQKHADIDTLIAGHTSQIAAGDVTNPASAAGVALSATFGRKWQTYLEVNEDFGTYPDGIPALTSNGQPFLMSTGSGSAFSNATDRTPRVVSGKLTYAPTADIGGYATVLMDAPLKRIGAAFTFSPYSAPGGLAAFAVMTNQVAVGGGTFRAPIHFTISPEGWDIGVFQTDGSSVVGITGGTFIPQLTADDSVVYEASVALDRTAGYAYISLPDGTVVRSPQSDYFKTAATYAYWEPFRSADPTGKTLAKFTRIWADSRAGDSDIVPRAIDKATRPAVVSSETGQNANTAFTNADVQVTGVRCVTVVPTTQKYLVRMTGFIDITVAGAFRFDLMDDSGSLLTYRTVGTRPEHSGSVTAEMTYTTSVKPGGIMAFRAGFFASSGTGVLRLGGTATELHTFTMTVIPIG